MRETTRAQLAVVLAAMMIGTTGTAQALGPDGSTPLGVGAVRAVVGAGALWCLVPEPTLRPFRHSPGVVALGSAGVAVYQPAFFLGVDRLGVAMGTILAIGSGPVFAGLIDAALGRRPTINWLTGTALAVVGGGLIVGATSTGSNTLDGLGLLAALLAGLGYAVYAITADVMGRRGAHPTEVLAWQFALGSAVLIPVFFREPMGWVASWSGALMAAHLGVVTIAVAYWLVGYALRHVGAPSVTTLMQAEPVTAALLAVVVLNETLPTLGWAGAVLAVVGLMVATRSASPGSAAREGPRSASSGRPAATAGRGRRRRSNR